jgi:hypothetical protein
MARVQKMTHGKISLAHEIHCCPILYISAARRAYLHCEEYIYIYIHTYSYIHTHTYDCVEIVFEITLVANRPNTANETFLHKSGAVRSVEWIFINWGSRQTGDNRVNT